MHIASVALILFILLLSALNLQICEWVRGVQNCSRITVLFAPPLFLFPNIHTHTFASVWQWLSSLFLPPPLYHAFALLCFVWELIYIPSIDKASHVPMWSPRTVIYRICPKPKREHSRICIATVVTTAIRTAQ